MVCQLHVAQRPLLGVRRLVGALVAAAFGAALVAAAFGAAS